MQRSGRRVQCPGCILRGIFRSDPDIRWMQPTVWALIAIPTATLYMPGVPEGALE